MSEVDIQLTGDIMAVDSQLGQADSAEAGLKAVLATADAAGTGISGVATALATLESLLGQIPGLEDDERNLSDERAAIDAKRTTVQARRSAHADLIDKAEKTQSEADIAESEHVAATAKLEQCRALLTEARRTAVLESTAADMVEKRREELNQRANEAAEAQRVATQADEDLDEAAERLEALLRGNAAAHAASASHAGDPCPVCVRPLPDDFTAPITAETEQATTARSGAQKRAKTLATKLAEANESRKSAQAALDEAIKALQTAVVDRDQAREVASAVLGHLDPDQADETILTGVHKAVRQTADAKETATATAKAAHDAKSLFVNGVSCRLWIFRPWLRFGSWGAPARLGWLIGQLADELPCHDHGGGPQQHGLVVLG